MSMGGRWNVTLLGAGMALVGACDLSSLADKLAADFERGIQERANEEIRKAQARIGEDGGEVKAYGGAVAVPEGAVEGDVEVAVAETDPALIQAELPGVLQPVTPPMAFTPHGTTFEAPVTLSLFFERGLPSNDLHVVRLDNEQDTSWERVDPESIQYGEGVALVNTTHFSVYGVVRCEALPGELANVCDQFKSGEISLNELREVAPPDTNAWDDFGPRPGESGGGTDGPVEPPDEDRCEAVAKECQPVFDGCSQSPESDICSRIPDCIRRLEECGAVLPTPSDEDCSLLADGCSRGDTVACQIHDELCGPGPALDECEYLRQQCEYEGNEGACDKYDSNCTDVVEPQPTCVDLERACAGGDGDPEACNQLEEYCGGIGPDPDCIDLTDACLNGDDLACSEAYELGCPIVEPPPPEDCQVLVDACLNGDDASCVEADRNGCPFDQPPPPEECKILVDACIDGDELACDQAYELGCPPVEPPDVDCQGLVDACVNGDDASCLEAEANGCPPPPPAEDCITWELCNPEYCYQEVTCEPEPAPVPTDLTPPPGSYVQCYSETGEIWSCELAPVAPAP